MVFIRKLDWRLMLAAAALALSACASDPGRDRSLQPGVSGEAEVLSRFGKPVQVWDDGGGARTLEYSSQPFGQTCYMIHIGADGKLIGIEDTLLYASRFAITPGMTQEQVSRRLGKERRRVSYSLSGEEVWDWNVEPDQTGSSYLLRFNVHFKNGVVVRLSQSMVFPDRMGFGRD
ncbi:outer membrane protein assembly factor BamE [Roseateles violae]|uniref:Outer membrane protein assembly factor BamE n=1 Tax=Roseateles violae TaxID=3058042 RepID=A0ABT8DM80_9BURK|nr:outer membrane protein assembly factor BamE [Pelomonas sp. PFR6]MDN3919512.1 outer membrane protein assembly factor BamE [Pelomonas sp. PFR6]